jgi:hypothetical protein
MRIMDQLSSSIFKPVFNNTSLVFNPLIGGRTINSIEDFYGLFVTSSEEKINFYVLTPHQYFLIFSISTKIGLIHPLSAKILFEEEGDLKKSGIRKILFQENELINLNVGVKSCEKEKIGEISFFDILIKKEIFAFGDTLGNIAVYK